MYAPTTDEICTLLSDRSWGPPGVQSVVRSEINYGVCPLDHLELNNVSRVDPALRDPGAVVAEVIAAHPGRRSRWNVPRAQVSEALERALLSAGYRCLRTLAMFLEIPSHTRASAPVEDVADLAALRDWHRVRVACGRATTLPDAPALQAELALRASVGGRYRLLLVRVDGQPVSAGGLILYPDAHAGMLWGGGTVPDARGQGAYTALIQGRLALLAALGLRRAWTITIEGPSQRALASLGFSEVAPWFTFERPICD